MQLKKQATKGAIWLFVDQFGTQLVSFVVNIVLARLLLPSDFGTIALFGIVISISFFIINGGLSSSLIRTQKVDSGDLSTVFWFNIITSIVAYFTVFLLSPYIASFYAMPILTSLIRVYSLVLIIDSLVGVQTVLLEKELDFKTTFKIRVPSLIVGGAFGIYFAYSGFGVWSLVFSAIIQNSLFTAQHWLYSKWRPEFVFDVQKFKYHFGFGSRMTLSSLLSVTFNNLYSIVIGKWFSATELGFYNRADSLKQLPVNNISNTLSKVTYPLFAKISDDDQRLGKAYKEVLKLVIFIIAPVVGVMVLSAEPLVRLLLTEKWLPIVPYFQILAIAGVLQPIHSFNLNILQVKGRSDLFLRLEILKKVVVVIVILVGVNFGMMGLVWGQVAISIFSLFINTFYTAKFIHYSVFSQFRDLLPSLSLSLTIAIAIWRIDVSFLSSQVDLFRLCVIVLVYFLFFASISAMLKFKEWKLVKELVFKS